MSLVTRNMKGGGKNIYYVTQFLKYFLDFFFNIIFIEKKTLNTRVGGPEDFEHT